MLISNEFDKYLSFKIKIYVYSSNNIRPKVLLYYNYSAKINY